MNILFFTDTPQKYYAHKKLLTTKGYYLYFIKKNEDILAFIRGKESRIIIMDLSDEEIGKKSYIQEIKEFDPEMNIILLGSKIPNYQIAELIKMGICDYITKPFKLESLILILEDIQKMNQLRSETYLLEKKLSKKYFFCGIVGKSPQMLDVINLVRRVAKYSVSILITGETGTGKELVANAIHYLSSRKEKEFVACDCNAIPETLFEAELFGYKKGAFTGADKSRDGLFKIADKGTIFLDEIGEIPMSIQTKLLRVLQEKEFRPLGSSHDIHVDVRVISATNRNLRENIARGSFREDLFHRINIIEVSLPPLRERKDDISVLCRYFLEKFNQKYGKNVRGISKRAQRILMTYSWSGNVRELENIIERAVMLSQENFIDIKDFPENITQFLNIASMDKDTQITNLLTLEQAEKKHIIEVLKLAENNKQQAAKMLGKSRPALYRKLKKHNIPF